jgi:hypothetical protein
MWTTLCCICNTKLSTEQRAIRERRGVLTGRETDTPKRLASMGDQRHNRAKSMFAKLSACLLFSAVFWPAAQACNVPVFRYALERWPAESFDVVIYYRGTLEPDQKALAESLEKTQFANVEVTTLDLDSKLDPLLEKIFKSQTNVALPWTVVLPPHGDEVPAPLWSGHLTASVVTQLMDSPVRRELATRLLRGDSAVWLLLESGDRAADDRIGDLLTQELAKQQKEIALPPPDPDDPQMHASLPLRVAFSIAKCCCTAKRRQPTSRCCFRSSRVDVCSRRSREEERQRRSSTMHPHSFAVPAPAR